MPDILLWGLSSNPPLLCSTFNKIKFERNWPEVQLRYTTPSLYTVMMVLPSRESITKAHRSPADKEHAVINFAQPVVIRAMLTSTTVILPRTAMAPYASLISTLDALCLRCTAKNLLLKYCKQASLGHVNVYIVHVNVYTMSNSFVY